MQLFAAAQRSCILAEESDWRTEAKLLLILAQAIFLMLQAPGFQRKNRCSLCDAHIIALAIKILNEDAKFIYEGVSDSFARCIS